MKRYNLINNVLGWLCFVIAAATYLLTIEPTASFWDCPEFISQGAKLEVGHPPGNPIFMLTARFFVTIFGNSTANAAIAVNSMSALLSAATILLLFWTVTHLIKRLIVRDDAQDISWKQIAIIMGGGLCGALAYTWSDTFWFSAVEGEVYAFSSFCTALVFWLILKWENRADLPHSDRYLILIAYVIGVSIAVHLLNLLCIPAIGLVIYYKKFKKINAVGSLIALAVSCAVVGVILYGLVPGFVDMAQKFELLCVNGLGMGYNMGVLTYAIILVAVCCWTISELYKQKNAGRIKVGTFLTIVLSGIPFVGGSTLFIWVIILALAAYLFMFCPKVPVRIFNIIVLSIFVIFIGYSSYALLLIRASANTPMNQNAPDNVFTLASYLNREQYGDRPLFYGQTFAETLDAQEYPAQSGNYVVPVDEYGRPTTKIIEPYLRDEDGAAFNTPKKNYAKVVKTSPDQADEYVQAIETPSYKTLPDLNMLLTRIYSTDPSHVAAYKSWAYYSTPDIDDIPEAVRAEWAQNGGAWLYEVAPYMKHQTEITTAVDADGNAVDQVTGWKPGFDVNLRYFVNYQLNHMYWRYFMWNFAGRQNDISGNGEPHLGNWISGIPAIDNARLGDQSLLPDEFGKGNKGHNVFYMLPLLLGVIGLLWQALYRHRSDSRRGIEQFWVVFFLFFMTGIAIVLYLNQTPGQPRERDYAFAGSFYAFAIWIGLGVPAIAALLQDLIARFSGKKAVKGAAKPAEVAADNREASWATAAIAIVIGVAVPLQMVSQTWDDHDRSGRYTCRDYGMNYLSSLDKDAIIITYGDNDTFPLWYAQEVEGYRTDVRVVNSSYLTTDWYANQMKHPYYDAKAIEMYAKPEDYAYDRLAWSYYIPMGNDTIVDAEEALRSLYASDATQVGAPYLTTPNIYFPADTAATIKHFNLTSSRTDLDMFTDYYSDIYVDLNRSGRGMSLYRTLLIDMLSNSIKNGWNRPIYIATTVPTSQYQGFAPYLASSGMAYEITPFNNAPISVNVEKAYENILDKFRWGGLDAAGADKLYLDETVRRMAASTRSGVYTTVEELLATGDLPASAWAKKHAKEAGEAVPVTRYDMARRLLDLLQEKIPASLVPYDGMIGVYFARDYFELYTIDDDKADLDKAEKLLNAEADRYAQLIKYATSLSQSNLNALGRSDTYALQYLGAVLALKNRISVLRALEKKADVPEDIMETVKTRPEFEDDLRVAPLIYIESFTKADMQKQRDSFSGAQAMVVDQAMSMLEAHEYAGVEPHKFTDELAKRYKIDVNRWIRLLHY
jgi:hypothetical protein